MKKEYSSPAIMVMDIHTNNVIVATSLPPEGEHAGAKLFDTDFDEPSTTDDSWN